MLAAQLKLEKDRLAEAAAARAHRAATGGRPASVYKDVFEQVAIGGGARKMAKEDEAVAAAESAPVGIFAPGQLTKDPRELDLDWNPWAGE